MILEILLIGFILYCAYQVIAIPLYAFGFFGSVIVVAFVVPLLVLGVQFYFANTGIAWLVIGILVLLGILASRGTTVAK